MIIVMSLYILSDPVINQFMTRVNSLHTVLCVFLLALANYTQ
uniref:Uncharacterized protein n=1 Tax=Anguilla anguilla TaxID=7936 RepID=A0A0E9T281_ANGAN